MLHNGLMVNWIFCWHLCHTNILNHAWSIQKRLEGWSERRTRRQNNWMSHLSFWLLFCLFAGFSGRQLVCLMLRLTQEMVLWWGHRQQVEGTSTTGLFSRISSRYNLMYSNDTSIAFFILLTLKCSS